jgi:sugar phosphate isomerase/epimerase
MGKYGYTSNCWGYYHVRESFTPETAARHVCEQGFDGFDLFAGPESVPDLPLEAPDAAFTAIRAAAEAGGGRIASLVLVGFDCSSAEAAAGQLRAALRIAPLLGTRMVHLLPRKPGVTQRAGFDNLAAAWKRAGRALTDAGLTCTAENHAWTPAADDDIFLVRSEADFNRVLDVTGGGIRVKFDASWLLHHDAAADVTGALTRLLPHVAVLDLKDWRDGTFVKPGTGLVDFPALARIIVSAKIPALAVEAEHHHGWSPTPADVGVIDAVHREDLAYYKGVFG